MHYPKKHYDVTVVVWKGTIPFKKADPWVDHAWTYSRQMSDSSSFLDLQNHLIGPAKKSPSLKFKPSFNNTSSFALHNWIWLFPNWNNFFTWHLPSKCSALRAANCCITWRFGLDYNPSSWSKSVGRKLLNVNWLAPKIRSNEEDKLSGYC